MTKPFNVGSRATCWYVKGQIKKVFHDSDDGRRAFRNEEIANLEFSKFPWFEPWTEHGADWFTSKFYPRKSRLDRVALIMSYEERREIAGRVLSIVLDMLVLGYAHRDLHVKNLYLLDGKLKLKDFESLTKYNGPKPGLQNCYDVTGQGLAHPWGTDGVYYNRNVPHPGRRQWSLSIVLADYFEAEVQLEKILTQELLDASATSRSRDGRHTPAQQKIYTGFSLPGFRVDDAQRDCAKRHERFGSAEILPGKSVLDLGCHVGGMLFEAQRFKPGECLGLEFDKDKVVVTRRVAAFCGLNDVEFIQTDIDEVYQEYFGKSSYDVVMCLALEAHVQDSKRLYRLLGQLTHEVLFFEGNANTDVRRVVAALKDGGFSRVAILGICDDDSREENNCRPLLRAWK